MAAEKRAKKAVQATEDDVKRAAALAQRVHEMAQFVADQVASWSRIGEPYPRETARALRDLGTALSTLSDGRSKDDGAELEVVVRDVIHAVRAGNLVRGAVMLVADATKKTNAALASQIVDQRDAIIAIVDKVIFFQLPPIEIRDLVQDLAVRMRMREKAATSAAKPKEATVAGRRAPKARKTAKSRVGV